MSENPIKSKLQQEIFELNNQRLVGLPMVPLIFFPFPIKNYSFFVGKKQSFQGFEHGSSVQLWQQSNDCRGN